MTTVLPPRYNKKYSKEEIELFKKLYPTIKNKKIAKILGRTTASITRKGNKLGLKKEVRYQILICDNCGKKFKRYNSIKDQRIKENCKKSYCNRGCFIESRGSKIVKCSGCGIDFPIELYRYKSQKSFHCSFECRRSKPINCDWCGKEFRRRPANKKAHNFCSKNCELEWRSEIMRGKNNINWSGGLWNGNYGPNWYKQKKKARERDKYMCQNCGITEEKYEKALDVHHIEPFIKFGLKRYEEANKLENLISVCNPCHSKIEPRRRKNEYN